MWRNQAKRKVTQTFPYSFKEQSLAAFCPKQIRALTARCFASFNFCPTRIQHAFLSFHMTKATQACLSYLVSIGVTCRLITRMRVTFVSNLFYIYNASDIECQHYHFCCFQFFSLYVSSTTALFTCIFTMFTFVHAKNKTERATYPRMMHAPVHLNKLQDSKSLN